MHEACHNTLQELNMSGAEQFQLTKFAKSAG